jgi:Fibronectin type III domain
VEWLILLLLAPAVVVPVVGLWGFAGCNFEHGAFATSVVAPVNLQAVAKSDQRVDLNWEQGDTNTVSYRIDRAPDGGGFVTIADNVTDTNFVDDNGLMPNTKYFYEVRTIVADSSLSDPAETNAKTFALAFQIDPALPPLDHADTGNFCYVQRISAAKLLADGSKLRLQVWGSPAGNVTVHRIYISRVANPGNPNDYQSAGDIKPVLTSDLTLPNDQPIFLPDLNNDPIDYTLDQTMDLIIALDFTATAAQGNSRHVNQPLVDLHWKPGVQQAAGPRDANYILLSNRLDFVTKVIVVS